MKNFKAVSMPCTEEQWLNEVKPLCDKYGLYYFHLTNFDQFKYLHLDFINKDEVFITNGVYLADISVIPYNPIEFIKACGVKLFPEKWCVKGDNDRFPKLVKKMRWSTEYWQGNGCEYNAYYTVINNVLQYYNKEELPQGYTEVTLDELIKHFECSEPTEQPKWEKLTRGGYEYHIYEEFDGVLFGRYKDSSGYWNAIRWYNNGMVTFINDNIADLIRHNPRKHELLSKKAELEKQLEEINKELNQ